MGYTLLFFTLYLNISKNINVELKIDIAISKKIFIEKYFDNFSK